MFHQSENNHGNQSAHHLIAYCVVCALFCMTVAKQKGYSEAGWFFAGLITGILALIAIAGMPLSASAKAELQKAVAARLKKERDLMEPGNYLRGAREVSSAFHVSAAQASAKEGLPKLSHSHLVYSALEYRCAIERIVLEAVQSSRWRCQARRGYPSRNRSRPCSNG